MNIIGAAFLKKNLSAKYIFMIKNMRLPKIGAKTTQRKCVTFTKIWRC